MSDLTRCKLLSVIKIAEGPEEKLQWPLAHCNETSVTDYYYCYYLLILSLLIDYLLSIYIIYYYILLSQMLFLIFFIFVNPWGV